MKQSGHIPTHVKVFECVCDFRVSLTGSFRFASGFSSGFRKDLHIHSNTFKCVGMCPLKFNLAQFLCQLTCSHVLFLKGSSIYYVVTPGGRRGNGVEGGERKEGGKGD